MLSTIGKGMLLLLVLLVGSAAPAVAVDFKGFWQYRETGGEGVDSRSTFQQRYSLGAGMGMTWQPTHAISAGFNLGYTRSDRDAGSGMDSTEEIVPSASLNLTNDIFRASLSGTASEGRNSRGGDLSSHSWDATLASAWDRVLWPNLWLNYGETSDSAVGRRDQEGGETRGSRYGLGLDWDLLLAKLFYAYSHSEFEDGDVDSSSEQDSHFARLETGGSFWQKRISFSLSQQFQHSTSEFSATIPDEGFFARPLEVETLSAVDDPVLAPEAELVQLTSNPLLADDDRESLSGPAVAVPPLERGHFGIRFDLDEQVEEIYLYLDPLSQLTPAQIETLQWDLYTRNLLDGFWEPAAEDLPVVYNAESNRFELTINRRLREFKVVTTNQAGVTLNFTELEAISHLRDDSSGSEQTTLLTTANLRVLLSRTLTASSSMTLERTDAESGDAESDTSRRSLSGSLRWTPLPTVAPAVRFSESRQDATGEDEETLRSYSLLIATFPLPTLNVTVGATRSDRYTGPRKTATSDNYTLTSTAQIYPDLVAAFNATYVTSTREREETEDADVSTELTVDTFSTRLNLNARLNPRLTADLTADYRESETDTDTTNSADSTLSLAYRPSDLLSMRLTGTRRWLGQDTPDTLAFNLNLSLLRTHNTRVAFHYNSILGDQTVNSFGLDGSWEISRNVAFQTRLNYAIAEVQTWNVQASLAFRL